MYLRRAFPRNRHVCAIEHRLICSHIVIDDLEYHIELPDNDLTLILLAAEKCQTLAYAYSLHVC